ncbi:MAG: glycolate oxidase iron-sulfur subunit [Betaproteobacteria bacterium RIFCSPLOWO2_12_FULL_65_14]|nr:MAG: glycolate oxidase iron-sulfur subunit [Betaproteobacteria bacterium RIFCSPLOWO2_12_FULL_65_14]
MQTELADFIRDTDAGREAEAILRKCVHCGFCTATCPTYQLLGDDLDSPRGRIYLMKRALEGAPVTARTRLHLDRCLTCRACESTCPSGVRYSRLVDIGRAVVEERTARPPWERLQRALLAFALPRTRLFGAALRLGWLLRPLLPGRLKDKVPARASPAGEWPAPRHARKMLVLAGCVQPALAPSINAAAARVLDRFGISLVEAPHAGCCGAVRFHLNYQEAGREDMRALIDAWWPTIERGEVEAIVFTASGCGSTVKDYGDLLAEDADYRDKARRVAALARDLSEVVPFDAIPEGLASARVAFQSPCSLQHGQQIRGTVEARLARAGFQTTVVRDGHLCCGSAGSYSLLQPDIARELRARKIESLEEGAPQCIATANIGCLAHLQPAASVPVRHWVELLDEALARKIPT